MDKIDVSIVLADLLTGKLSKHLLPYVLHEVTHYWTFTSLVGQSLSIIGLESKSKLTKINDDDLLYVKEMASLDIMYNSVFTFLQPLLEGMAEFAEFDLAPGSSSLISQVSNIMGILFLMKDLRELDIHNINDVDVSQLLIESLYSKRLTNLFIERKKALYYHSIDPLKSSYLTGYLTVKNMQRTLILNCKRFTDSELFFIYLKAFFFEDPELAKIILSEYKDPFEIPSIVINYFHKRIMKFFQIDHSKYIDVFINELLNKKSSIYKIDSYVTGKIESFSVDQQKTDELIEVLMNSRIKSMIDIHPDSDSKIRKLFISLLLQRNVITIANNQVLIKTDKAGRLTLFDINGKPMLSLDTEHTICNNFEGLLDVNVFLLFEPLGLHVVISEQDKVLSSFCLNGKKIPDDKLDYFIGRNQTLATIKELTKGSSFLKTDEVFNIYVKYMEENIFPNLKNLFNGAALFNIPDDFYLQTLEKMEIAGLSSILDDDDLLYDFTIASIVSTHYLNPYSSEINSFVRGKSLINSIKKINFKIEKILGFKNFILVGNETIHTSL
ncbi:hypothetical protein [Chryseobacterium sp. G0162]|uniref:hypothetical protein n=1 Tax=Chryseobacterium sp. G0162 TaxID=2487063 RepID=UPI000F4D2EFA|nr:hypothetical protein [Chryseobacterium sp. G0162]